MKKRDTLFHLVFIILLSTINLQAITPAQLNKYFTRFKRGLHCFIKRKPCTAEDKKAVYQAGGTLLGILAIIGGRKLFQAYSPKLGKMFLTSEEKEILALPSDQQQIARDEYLLDAVENNDLPKVKFWLAHGADSNASFGYYRKIIYAGKDIDTSGRLLNAAIRQFSRQWQENNLELKQQAKDIILTLLANGADPSLSVDYSFASLMSPSEIKRLSVKEYHHENTPYSSDSDIDKAMEEAIKRAHPKK